MSTEHLQGKSLRVDFFIDTLNARAPISQVELAAVVKTAVELQTESQHLDRTLKVATAIAHSQLWSASGPTAIRLEPDPELATNLTTLTRLAIAALDADLGSVAEVNSLGLLRDQVDIDTDKNRIIDTINTVQIYLNQLISQAQGRESNN